MMKPTHRRTPWGVLKALRGSSRFGQGYALVATFMLLISTAVAGVAGAPPASAAPGDAFDPTNPQVFVSQNNPAQLFRAIADGDGEVSFTPEGPPNVQGLGYNSISYNTTDNYLYGTVVFNYFVAPEGPGPKPGWERGSLIRIGQGGVVTRIGTNIIGNGSADVGAFHNGKLHVFQNSTDEIFVVNVTTGAVERTITDVTGTTTSTGGVRDFTSADGYLWGLNADGAVERFGVGAVPSHTVFPGVTRPTGTNNGAAWTFGNGNLGFQNNTSGDVYQVEVTNPSSANPSFRAVLVSKGPGTNYNDGAAIPGSPVDLSIEKNGPASYEPGDDLEFTLTVTNNSTVAASSGSTITDVLPAGLSFDPANSSASCSVNPDGDPQEVTCVTGQLSAGASVDLTIAVTAGAAMTECLVNTASVLGNEADNNASNNTDTAETCARSIAITKATPTELIPAEGEEVPYTFEVTNTGALPITEMVVTDPNATDITCDTDELAPGESTTCTGIHVVTAADLMAGEIINTAHVNGVTPEGPVESPSNTIIIPGAATPALTIVKSTTTDELPAVGEDIDYEFVVTNTGNITMNDIEVSDPNATNIECPETTLAPGETMTCTAVHTVTQDDVDAERVENVAAVVGTPPGGDPIDPVPSNPVVVEGDSVISLSIIKSAVQDELPEVGENIDYTFVVTNDGNVTMDNIDVTDPKVSDLECPEAVSLAPGESTTCTATHTVTQADWDAGEFENVAAVTGTPPGTDTPIPEVPSNTVVVPGMKDPSLSIVKAAAQDELPAIGETIDYTFVVTNDGNVTMDNIDVTDPKVSDLECPEAVSLAPGESTTCTATHTVTQADWDAGEFENVAAVTGTPPGTDTPIPEVPSNPVIVEGAQDPVLSIVKAADHETLPAVGEDIAYTFVVTNDGNVTMDNVKVLDDNATDMECEGTTLAPGESTTCTAIHTVTQADWDAGEVVNTAHTTGTPPGSDKDIPLVPSNEVVIPGGHDPALAIVKASEQTEMVDAEIGDVIDYTFEVTNTGNVTMDNVVVTDPNAEGIECSAAILAPAETMDCTATHALTAEDIAAGEVLNTAFVTGTPPGSDISIDEVPSNEVIVPIIPTPEAPSDPVTPEASPNPPVIQDTPSSPSAPTAPATPSIPLAYTGAGIAALALLAAGLTLGGVILAKRRRTAA